MRSRGRGSRKEVAIIPPSIDAFAPKNQELDRERVLSILTVAGLTRTKRLNSP